jgi:hypothetical protein
MVRYGQPLPGCDWSGIPIGLGVASPCVQEG